MTTKIRIESIEKDEPLYAEVLNNTPDRIKNDFIVPAGQQIIETSVRQKVDGKRNPRRNHDEPLRELGGAGVYILAPQQGILPPLYGRGPEFGNEIFEGERMVNIEHTIAPGELLGERKRWRRVSRVPPR